MYIDSLIIQMLYFNYNSIRNEVYLFLKTFPFIIFSLKYVFTNYIFKRNQFQVLYY